MPYHLDISRLDRLVVIVARGHVTPDDFVGATKQLIAAGVPHYAKIIDVSGATSELTKTQVEGIAKLLRDDPDTGSRGPVAFVIDPNREGFANAFADVTKSDRPVKLFESIHEARKWIAQKL